MMKRRDFFSRALAGLAALPFLTTEAVAKACKVGAAPAGKKVVKEEGKAAKRLKYVLTRQNQLIRNTSQALLA